MYEELSNCVEELRENHTDKEIACALAEYAQIVENVSRDYTDTATVADLRADHPELDFMDDDDIGDILGLARDMRREREMEEADLTAKDIYGLTLEKKWNMPLSVYEKIQDMISTGTPVHDLAVVIWLDNDKEWTVGSIEEVLLEYWREKHTGTEAQREEIFQQILEETRIRNHIEEEALRLVADGKNKEASELLEDLDDGILKGLYQEYWDLRAEG